MSSSDVNALKCDSVSVVLFQRLDESFAISTEVFPDFDLHRFIDKMVCQGKALVKNRDFYSRRLCAGHGNEDEK